MDGAIKIGKIFGIQFRLHYSWFVIFFLVTFFLSRQVFPHNLPHQAQATYWAMGITTSLLFFASVLAHELAHSIVGRANGIPVKSITLFIFGGAAHMTREASRPQNELKMAIAGPASSLLIAAMFGMLYLFLSGLTGHLALMAYWLAYINVVLAVFNLLPGFPLDGGRVLRSLIWHFNGNYMLATRIATQTGRIIGYLLILAGIGLMLAYQNFLSGIWLIFIGWFLADTARTSYRQAQLQEALKGFTASQVMTTDCPTVSGETIVSQLIQEYTATGGNRCFLVAEGGRVTGVLTLSKISSAAGKDGGDIKLKDIAFPLGKVPAAHPDQDVLSIVQLMNESGVDQMPVVSEGRIIGLITLDNLIGFVTLNTRLKVSPR